jgi:putative colanic acid biosynthesis UDP-glucose lipid carrier transferase
MPELFAVTKAVILALMLTIFVVALLAQGGLDRGFVLAYSAISLLFMVSYRTIVRLSLWNLRRRGYHFRRVLLIGANERTSNVARTLISNQFFGFQIVGYLEDDESRRPYLDNLGIRYYGRVRELETILQDRVVDVVYISLPVRSQYETIESIAHLCEGVGVPVRMLADLFPLRIASSRLTRLGDIPVLSLAESGTGGSPFSLNRVADLLVSTILIVILLPVWVLITLSIKLDSRGPVFSREARTAPRTLRPFNLLRFRTAATSEHQGNVNDSPEQATSDSGEEFTRVGRLLVRYSLDELPELVNIWCGQISSLDPIPDTTDKREAKRAEGPAADDIHEVRG